MNVRDEKGQALILALGFLMFFGLVIGVLLSLASASVLSSSQLREQRSTVYAADGATDAAIQVALKNIGIGAYGDPPLPGVRTRRRSVLADLLTTTATTSDATGGQRGMHVVAGLPSQPDRTVTFTTFVGGGTTPVVQATVLFHDQLVACHR